MKKIIFLVAITLLFVQFTTCKKSDQVDQAAVSNDGTINFFTGKVSITSNNNTVEAHVGDKIIQGMTIVTAKQSVVDIYFEHSIIRILENSSVTMKELTKNLSDNKEQTELYVQNGKVFSQVTKKLEENEKFKISTPTSVAGIRGTEFLVVEENGKCKISCVEGKVAVRDAKGDDSSSIDVEKGKAASIESGKDITVDELSEEEINSINQIKDDILRNKEEKKVSGKAANIEAKDATKIQAEAIKGEDK
ncbi:MAG: FecR family protein [Leptospirales bacterium]|nr:FecR family protein [Leptospirales bacterium]